MGQRVEGVIDPLTLTSSHPLEHPNMYLSLPLPFAPPPLPDAPPLDFFTPRNSRSRASHPQTIATQRARVLST